jgi:catechol 2,3-dioxygenase-like lactoylglutathione lyase family enzyme
MILGLHHVQITVPVGAEESARQFYCGLLGLPEIDKPEPLRKRGGFWLQVGDRQLHVAAEDELAKSRRAHVAYEVTDLAPWRARLAEAGIDVLDGEPIPGYRRCEFRDPFGNRVELLARV